MIAEDEQAGNTVVINPFDEGYDPEVADAASTPSAINKRRKLMLVVALILRMLQKTSTLLIARANSNESRALWSAIAESFPR